MKQRIRYFCLTLLVMVAGLTSAQDVIEISTVQQLKEFRDAVNGGNQYTGKTVKLTADLDLSGEANWKSIGNLVAYPGQSFDGVFDGQNHVISNLTVNDNTSNHATAALFGSVEFGTIKNLTVKNVNITSTHYAAGIVAYTSNTPTIENCHVIGGTIKSTPEIVNGSYDNGDKVGGIMGYATAGSTIKNCTVEGVTISGYRDLGGIVGYSDGTVTNNTAKNVTVTQDLTNGYKDTPPTTIGDIVGRGSATNNVEANGNIVIKSVFVAQIGETKYESLEAAFAAVKDGETVAMLSDVTLSDKMVLSLEGKTVSLDLGGKTLNGRTNLTSGKLTVKNGIVNCEGGQPLNVYGSATAGAENYSVLTIAEDVTVSGAYGVCMFGPTASSKAGYGAVINVAGTLNGTSGTVFVSGNLGQNITEDMHNVINITGTVNGNDDAGVAINGLATVNVKSGANITGNTGIAIKRGTLNVEDGATVHGTGAENLTPDPNNNGTEMTGAAVSMTDTYNQYGAMSVNITGGTFTSENTVALFKEEGTYASDATYAVSGGTFSSPVPAEFCAPGYEPKDLGNGQYSVYAPAYSVTVNKVDPKTDWYMGMTTSAIQFSITKDGSVLSTKDQYTEQLDKWDIILDENYLQLKSKVAAAKWIRCNLTPVGTGTTTVVFQNKANPSIKVEQEVTITHKLILVVQPSGTHMVEAGPVEIGGNTKFDGVKIEDYSQFTFTSSDETIATISGTTITPQKSGTITVTVTKKDDPSATASANITFIDAPAKIGETYYESISQALKAAKSGETITLLRDVTESTSFSGEQPRVSDFALTIDLNGHTWTGASQPYTLKMEYGVITIKDSQGGGGVKYGNDYAFIVSHLAADYPSKLILESGTFTGKTSVAQVGYPGGTGSNKKYYGGDLVINGGTFVTVPDAGETYDENGNFKYTLNMLDMVESSYPGGIYSPSTITVNGGKFLKFDPQNNLAEGANTNFVPEGLVSTKSVEDGEAWYTISKIVAKIDETTYTSLADAFTAAKDGQTITVLTDIDLPSTINVTKKVTLDLDGKKIFNTSDLWVGDNWSFFSVQANGNLTVTGDGTIDAKVNDCYTFDVRDGGILTIKDGTFTGNISCVYLYNKENIGVSTCNIEGGRFSIKQLANNVQDDKYRYLLNCHDASYASNTTKFNVTGGSFVNFNPANNQAEGVATNFCAAGYEAVQNDNVWTVQKAPVAKIDDEMYYSLADAFAAATDGATITLLANSEGNGIIAPQGKFKTTGLTVNFNNFTYTISGPSLAGSTGTKTQAFQLLKDNKITFKNGSIIANNSDVKMMIQNYSDLTLDNMVLDATQGTNKIGYVLSTNNGNTTIKDTKITAKEGGFAFDADSGWGNYASNEVTVKGESEINGNIKVAFENKTGGTPSVLTLTSGTFNGSIVMGSNADKCTVTKRNSLDIAAPADYKWVDNGDGTSTLKKDDGIFELVHGEPYPYPEGRMASKVTYRRSFAENEAGHYRCWYVPFDYTIQAEDMNNFDFYKIHMIAGSGDTGGEVADNTKVYIYIEKVKDAGTVLRGNRPYVIRPKSAMTDHIFTADNITEIYPENNESRLHQETTEFEYDYYGTYREHQATGRHEFISLNKKGQTQWNASENAKLQSYVWYIKVASRGDIDYAKTNIFFVDIDDDTTDIFRHQVDSNDVEGVYTVSGAKVEKPVKGVNIIRYKNGTTKKIYVK